ncbi:putative UDP-N-acetylglucosamine 2-epimerase [Clostridia bacterium]|nr:putative UDP-N-acetylglucosamine 2-epimerase [Clostridia bacterium]
MLPRVLSVFGTRPEASKMAPLVLELKKRGFESAVCVTAQHREMLDKMLELFGITPEYDLNIMKKGQTLSHITESVIAGMPAVFAEYKPDLVLVHGDTTTTFAAAIAAYYAQIKVGHVEAGLRTGNKLEPFPEEMNRRLCDAVADFHFAPTGGAKANLIKENITPENIFVTGNTAIDATKTTVKENYRFGDERLNGIDFKNERVIAVTAHRRENYGEPLKNICLALRDAAERLPNARIVYAVHPSPTVTETAYGILAGVSNVTLTEPLSLTDMHNLLSRAFLVMTDSGGLQEEAPAFHKPVIVLRNVTERPEGVETGALILAGTEREEVFSRASGLFYDGGLYKKMAQAKNPFGDGNASARIAEAIAYGFGASDIRPSEYTV